MTPVRSEELRGKARAMNKKRMLLLGAGLMVTLTFARWVHGDAADEIGRLAVLMNWKAGTVVADIGAGDGSYSFAAAGRVGVAGRVFATEIDREKIEELRAQVQKRKLQNVTVIESKEGDTNLPAACCDVIYLRRVYHHLTKPAEFDASLVRSLKPGGRLAIIDFPPRPSLPEVKGVPRNRGGHGVPQNVVIEELTAAGLRVERVVEDWPGESYCVVLVKN
jgi:ubiquinone/menaquinone biosynthesis C-methylase UbiE